MLFLVTGKFRHKSHKSNVKYDKNTYYDRGSNLCGSSLCYLIREGKDYFKAFKLISLAALSARAGFFDTALFN